MSGRPWNGEPVLGRPGRGGATATKAPSTQLRNALVRGTGAALVSALALVACSRRETGSPLAGLNAVSHWAWGDADSRRNGFSWKHTVLGALTHHAASVFWGYGFERLFASRRARPTATRLLGESALMSGLACAVDYTITPKRFTPGYELRLSRPSLLAVYGAFAAGLALGSAVLPHHER